MIGDYNLSNIDLVVSVTEDATTAAASTMTNLSRDTNNCRAVFRFYTDAVVAGPLCIAGIIGSCLAFAALGLDTALSPTAAFLLRCLALSDGVLQACWLNSHTLPALLEFVGVDESLQSMSWTRMRTMLSPLMFISQMTTVWLTALIASWRYVTVGLLSTPGCPGNRVGAAVCSLYGIRALVATIVILSVAFNVPRFFQFFPLDIVDADNVTRHMQVFFSFCCMLMVLILSYKAVCF